ncbi:MAG TPA: histidine phosphatase family protein [Panacibacter sp.]|mgnify:CR=1|nr:histidine phosphatase family protein [Panacibacter sp.]HNP43995.1 histidine phosphatase family protein [Panacibacter sp.]
MKQILCFLLGAWLLTGCSNYIYVVRHAEKGVSPAADPSLTAAGEQRAVDLANLLKEKNIGFIYSTNTTRTIKTATPLSDSIHKAITLYAPDTTALLVAKLKSLHANVLLVGHSNTVLPLLDSFKLAHHLQRIPDDGFNNLFIVKATHFLWTRVSLTETTYGAP